jgi:F-type H+-transporting ATPase subunit epsilon
MANLLLEVISPERIMFAGEVKSVLLPATEGDMTIYYGHEPIIASLNPGLIVVTDSEGGGHTAFLSGGFVEISGTKMTILAQRALPMADLTSEHLAEEIIHHETIRDSTLNERARQEAELMLGRLHQMKAALAFNANH